MGQGERSADFDRRPGRRRLLVLLPLLALLPLGPWIAAACTPAESGDGLRVFAAASLRDVLSELAARYDERSGERTHFNFAGSGVLARQIASSPRVALADVFVSADAAWVEELARAGRVLAGSRVALFSGQLVAVSRPDAPAPVAQPLDLLGPGVRHVLVSDPDAAPAGRYARAWLSGIDAGDGRDLWSALESKRAPTLDVRAALALARVERDAVALVYATDAQSAPDLITRFVAGGPSAPAVRYFGCALAAPGARSQGARRFLEFLAEPESLAIAARHGFGGADG